MTLTPDKAYLIGLIIGGGIIQGNRLNIKLPFRTWGDPGSNPSRSGEIANDILNVVKPLLKAQYGLDISYKVLKRDWEIYVDGDIEEVKNDLIKCGINPADEIRKKASFVEISKILKTDLLKRKFLAGLADTIGSTNSNHRRFSNDIQIISFEINGFEFESVCELCKMLHSIGCYPDQILWNHPNFHSNSDPYYESWEKGFKVRVMIDQYEKFGAFAFRAKAESARDNQKKQTKRNTALPCTQSSISARQGCIHEDEWSEVLPTVIRGGHYIHNKHVCAVLGCEYAPYDRIEKILDRAHEYTSPFPLQHKDSLDGIKLIIANDELLSKINYSVKEVDVSSLYSRYKSGVKYFNFDNSVGQYSLSAVLQGIAFIWSKEAGTTKGNRYEGSFEKIIENGIEEEHTGIVIWVPIRPVPVVVTDGENGVMVGPSYPVLSKNLISRDPENKYKINVRPLTMDDLDEYTQT